MSGAETLGWILAGGAGRRLGEPKARALLAGRPLLAHVATRLTPQCARLVVNSDDAGLADLAPGLIAVSDVAPGRLGPLAGLLTALGFLDTAGSTLHWIVTAPVDTPFLPQDLVARLHAARGERPAVVATSAGRVHGTIGLWSRALLPDLADQLLVRDERRVEAWVERIGSGHLELPPVRPDPLFNINTPADLQAAEQLIAEG